MIGGNLKELSSVISKKNHDNFGNNTRNRTIGLEESQVVSGRDTGNLGIKLEKESAKREFRRSYAPRLAATPEGDADQSFSRKNDFPGPQSYTGGVVYV